MGEVVDVSRFAKSVGIRHKCLMSKDVLGLGDSEDVVVQQERIAAKAMGILFWLRRAWESETAGSPPRVFEAKTGGHEGRRFEVQMVDDSILVGISN